MAAPTLMRPSGVSDRVGNSIWRRIAATYGTPVASSTAVLLIWYLGVVVLDPNPIVFPSPVAVGGQLVEVAQKGLLWPPFIESMKALAIGLGLALVVGVVLGLLVGMSRLADALTGPYLWAYFAMPDIAIAPLVILWLGFGTETKIWMIFLAATVPLMLACKDGVQSVDASMVTAARSFGASRTQMFRTVMVPCTLPFIASGVRNAISRGFVGLLVVELLVGSGGLGSQVTRAYRQFNTARMFAFILVLVFIALALISLSKRLEGLANRWREEVKL